MYPTTMVSLPCLKPTCSATRGVSPAQAPQRPASLPSQGRAWGREMFFRKPTAELSVSSHSKREELWAGNTLHTRGNRESEAELLRQHERNILLPDLEGHEKGKGTQTGILGPAERSPSWHISLKDLRRSRKEIRLWAKSVCFSGKVAGGNKVCLVAGQLQSLRTLCRETVTGER